MFPSVLSGKLIDGRGGLFRLRDALQLALVEAREVLCARLAVERDLGGALGKFAFWRHGRSWSMWCVVGVCVVAGEAWLLGR